MSATPKKNLMLFSGRAHPELAEQVAKHLDVTITPQSAYSFANGEIFVRFEESVRGCDAFVIQAHSAPINDQIMEHLIMTVDLHTAQIQGFFDGPVDHLFALPVLAEHIQRTYADEQIAVVSPDSGRVRLAER